MVREYRSGVRRRRDSGTEKDPQKGFRVATVSSGVWTARVRGPTGPTPDPEDRGFSVGEHSANPEPRRVLESDFLSFTVFESGPVGTTPILLRTNPTVSVLPLCPGRPGLDRTQVGVGERTQGMRSHDRAGDEW